MPAWINWGAFVGLAFVLSLVAVGAFLLRWIGKRAFLMANEWCDDRLLSLLHIQEVSRQSRKSLSIQGLRAVVLDKKLSQKLFDLTVYDHDLHRERQVTLKVASPFHPFGFKACEPQWHDEGIELRAKKAANKNVTRAGAKTEEFA